MQYKDDHSNLPPFYKMERRGKYSKLVKADQSQELRVNRQGDRYTMVNDGKGGFYPKVVVTKSYFKRRISQ